ncbi:MAG: transposase [bacterium]
MLAQACVRVSLQLLVYCVMPNHWHLVVWPRHDGDLSRFMNWLTLTHSQRWHQYRHTVGEGHVYQGRFKSFPVETNDYLLTVCRYVERNPVRAVSSSEPNTGDGAVPGNGGVGAGISRSVIGPLYGLLSEASGSTRMRGRSRSRRCGVV